MELGSTVTLKYVGKTLDGEQFGYADEEHPMVFQTGMDLTIPGFEKEILEMNEAGEKKTFVIGQYDAYGERNEEFIADVPKINIPFETEVGQRVWITDEQGEKVPVTVLEVKDDSVVFDLNHPLAGKDLQFDVEILKIEDAPENFVSAAEKKKRMDQMSSMLGGGDEDPNTIMM